MNSWEIDSITSAPKLLAAISQFLPAAHNVSFEIRNACSEALKIFAKHHSPAKYRVYRDTPETQVYYCVISKSLADDLEELLRSYETNEVFWHIKGFDDRKMLFASHDAYFDGNPVVFSSHIDSKVIQAIGSALERKSTKLDTGYNWDKNHRPEKGS